MHSWIHHVYIVFSHLGGLGLFIVSVIDSSPLFMPFGNDLFMIALTARKPHAMLLYAFAAAAGSVLGCLTVDIPARKGGEAGFEKTVSPKRFNSIKRRVKNNAAWWIVMASLMPPPFPYTAVVAGSAAFQYPRKRLLAVIGVSRFVRFIIDGLLAIHFSHRIFQLAKSQAVFYSCIGLVILSIGVSATIVWKWVKPAKKAQAA